MKKVRAFFKMRKQILNFFLDEAMMFSVFCDWVTALPIGHEQALPMLISSKKGEALHTATAT